MHQKLTLVGTVVLNNEVVQDDIDANSAEDRDPHPGPHAASSSTAAQDFTFTYLQLDHGSRDVAAVEGEIEHVIPSVLPV